MDTTEGYARLAEAVANRRTDLDRTQMEVALAGGLSLDRVSAIERGEARNLRPKTIRALERGLAWETGSVRAVLTGGQPRPVTCDPHAGPEPPGPAAPEMSLEEKMARATELLAEAQELLAEMHREHRRGA